jgi:hypothetical protein
MKLINNSEEFTLQYNGSDFTIPQGEFEVMNSNLAFHILFISNKWGKDVKDLNVKDENAIRQTKTPIMPISEKAPVQPEKVIEKVVEKEIEVNIPLEVEKHIVTEEDLKINEGALEEAGIKAGDEIGIPVAPVKRRQGRPKKNA